MGPRLVVVAALLMLAAADARAARERTGSIDAFLVLDESGSMKPIFSKVLVYVAEAIVRDYLEPQDYLCMVGFSDVSRVRVSQRLSSAAEKENLAALVKNLNVVPQGYTDMGRALEEIQRQIDHLADPSHQQVILILTDGLNQPPRDSPYFDPAKRDIGTGLAPPSGFNQHFQQQVQALAARGHRIHVVGIGTETDARKLAEALGAGYTILRDFNIEELRTGLAGFWDDTINLEGLDVPPGPLRPGQSLTAKVRLRSTSDSQREVELKAVRAVTLPLGAASAAPAPGGVAVTLSATRVALPPGGRGGFDVRVSLPEGFPSGDYRFTLAFDLASAVKFYPQQADVAFHVPSFWELHGRAVVASAVAGIVLVVGFVLYRRRAIPLVLVAEGDAAGSAKPIPFRIAMACSLGGGATDRFRVAGLPQKVAVFERRSVDRFALLSSQPELVPTLLEYHLGQPVEVRTGSGPSDRKVIRFVRHTRKPASSRPRPPAPVRTTRAPAGGEGGVDFR
jgi:Mg-chelatase subunit ChlD